MTNGDDATRRRLPGKARAAVAACVLGMAAVALWPPFEVLGFDLEPVGTERRSVFAERPTDGGVRRLHLWRLCLDECLLLGVAIAVVVTSRPPAPRRREPDLLPPDYSSYR